MWSHPARIILPNVPLRFRSREPVLARTGGPLSQTGSQMSHFLCRNPDKSCNTLALRGSARICETLVVNTTARHHRLPAAAYRHFANSYGDGRYSVVLQVSARVILAGRDDGRKHTASSRIAARRPGRQHPIVARSSPKRPCVRSR